MIELPIKRLDAEQKNPGTLLIYGKPKCGKTTAVNALENNLILDFEGGSKFLDAMAVQIRSLKDLREAIDAIKAKNKEAGGFFYDYITIDSLTAFEDLAEELALLQYQQSPMAKDKTTGKIYSGKVVNLPNGAGYKWLRDAIEDMYKPILGLAKHIIFVGHVKDKLINKDGMEMSSMELDLTGKAAKILASKCDAVGLIYREGNTTVINFENKADITTEARAKHISGKKIVIAETDENKDFTFHWDKVYLPEEKEQNDIK